MEEITFGGYAIPLVLTVILAIVYKFITFGDQYKALLAVGAGIALGVLAIPYKGIDWTVVNIVDHALYGFMTGAASVGIYELQRTVTNPRD